MQNTNTIKASGAYTDKDGEPVTDVKMASDSRWGIGRNRAYGGTVTESNDEHCQLNEINSEFAKDTIKVPSRLRNIACKSSGEIGRNIGKNGEVSVSNAYKIMHKVRNGDDIGTDKRITDFLDKTLKRKERISRNSKELKRDMGIENAFQKSGGTKNGGGKAHTNKTSDGSNITYFN